MTLGAALNAAAQDPMIDTIWVSQGFYQPSNSDETVSFVIPPGVEVLGGFAGDETMLGQRPTTLFEQTVLDGNIAGIGNPLNTDHVVRIDPPAGDAADPTILDGFLITNGYAQNATGATSAGSGAGLLIGDGTQAVRKVRLVNLTFRDCRAVQSGGAVAGFNVQRMEMHSCSFFSNRAGRQVGPAFEGSGGGIYLEDSGFVADHVAMHNIRMSSNQAPRGAALSIKNAAGGRTSLLNALVTGNQSFLPSAAILADVDSPGSAGAARLILSHCTVTGNNGGGVELIAPDGNPGNNHFVSIQSSILWGNRRVQDGIAAADANLFGGALTVAPGSVAVSYSNIGIGLQTSGGGTPFAGTNNINTNPKFGSGFELSSSSPCLDAADDERLDAPFGNLGLGDVADLNNNVIVAEPIEIDLKGEDREVDSLIITDTGLDLSFGGRISDMGCFEKQNLASTGGDQ
jgi:hypothetical protein